MVVFDSASSLLGAITSAHDDRNDLAVGIENGTRYRVTVDMLVNHGDVDSDLSPTVLEPVDADAPPDQQSSNTTLGVAAGGNGSGVLIYLLGLPAYTGHGDLPFGIYCRTPPNYENWVTSGSENVPKGELACSLEQRGKALPGDPEYKQGQPHRANSGVASTWAGGGVELRTSISNTSPATCVIELVQH